jgi:hypothetical protein
MKKIIALLIMAVLFTTGCNTGKVTQKTPETKAPSSGQNNNTTGQQDKKEEENTTGKQSNTSGENQGKAGITKVKVFLIAIEDNGKSGKKVGAGDSAVPVEVTVEPTNAPLTAALNKLFSMKDKNYGQSGLYNALYQSSLKLESVTIKDGKAEIRLSGNLKLGGVLDNPRVKAQIEETALQFSTVNKVSVYLKDKTLDEALSLK